MAWLLLSCAILTEIAATTALKSTNGLNIFTHTFLTIAVIVLYISSYVCMAQALKLQLEVSVAYAMWSGIGTAAIAVIGAMFFQESVHPIKIGAIALIVVGVAMLNLVPDSQSATSEAGAVHAAAMAPGNLTTNMALTGAMTGLAVTGGRHRASVGAAYPAAFAAMPLGAPHADAYADDHGDVYADSYGDGYGEPRRARHARRAWGQAAEQLTPLPDPRTPDPVPGNHVPRQRVPGHYGPSTHVPAEYVSDAHASGEYVHETPGRGSSDSDAYDLYASESVVPRPYVSESDIPVHRVPAYGVPGTVQGVPPVAAPMPSHAQPTARQAAYLGTDDVADFRADLDAALDADLDGHLDGHYEADIVVDPASVESPAAIERQPASVTRIPPRRRAPIKGVTLLHPYPDHPTARAPRSA